MRGSLVRLGGDAERYAGAIPYGGDSLCHGSLLGEGRFRRGDGLLVAGSLGYPGEQLVGGDLEVLECEGKAGQLGRGWTR